jgi:PBP1b-binding outer membrane lipoprotein LpoB
MTSRLARSAGLVALGLTLLAASACNSPPRRIDPTGPEAITTEQLDYSDLREWADSLTQELLVDGFLDAYPKPVIMQVSNVENKTSISDINTEMVLGRIRSGLRKDNRVRFVATLGTDARDESVRDNTQLNNDPMFNQQQVAERTAQGTASVPMLSVNCQILGAYERRNNARQRNYEMRMWVVDLRSGETVWEGFSNTVGKLQR